MTYRSHRRFAAAVFLLAVLAAPFVGAQTPTVSGVSITSSPASGDTYELAEQIEVLVTFDQGVNVTGRPQLALTIGATTRQATYYLIQNNFRSIGFRYAVQSSDSDSDGIGTGASALTLNGGTIKIRGGTTDATLGLGTHAIANSANHKVDGSLETAPTVSGVNLAGPVSGDTFELAETMEIFVGFDREVNVTGTPQLALNIGTTTRQMEYAWTFGTEIYFHYVVQPSDRDSDGVSIGANALTLNGGTIKIKGGTENATLGLGTHAVANSTNHKVDGSQETAPTVSSVSIWSRPVAGDL